MLLQLFSSTSPLAPPQQSVYTLNSFLSIPKLPLSPRCNIRFLKNSKNLRDPHLSTPKILSTASAVSRGRPASSVGSPGCGRRKSGNYLIKETMRLIVMDLQQNIVLKTMFKKKVSESPTKTDQTKRYRKRNNKVSGRRSTPKVVLVVAGLSRSEIPCCWHGECLGIRDSCFQIASTIGCCPQA